MLKSLLTALLLTTSIWAQFSGGDGSASNPWKIATFEDLQHMRDLVNESEGSPYRSHHYTVTANIDMSSDGNWEPIGNIDRRQFIGVFDGGGFRLTGLTITGGTNGSNIGLFGFVGSSLEDGTVRNVALEGVSINTIQGNVGGIAGHLGIGTITNTYVSGSIIGNNNVGGIVGINFRGTVEGNYSTASVSGNSAVGGIAGVNMVTLQRNYSTASVSGGGAVGGIVGVLVSGSVSRNVALNPSVSDNGGSVGRVAGVPDGGGGGTLDNNYAWVGMHVNGSLVTTNNAADMNGAYVLAYQVLDITNPFWATVGFIPQRAIDTTQTSNAHLTTRNVTVAANPVGGGTVGVVSHSTAKAAIREVVELSQSANQFYTFDSWSGAEVTNNEFTMGNEAITVTANYTVPNYNVTWNADYGMPEPTQITVYHFANINHPAAMTRTGHTFGGWFTDATLTTAANFPIEATGEAEFWAKWTANEYNITYENTFGVTNPNPAKYTFGAGVVFQDLADRAGFAFSNWYEDANLTLPISEITATRTGDVTVYARWTACGGHVWRNNDCQQGCENCDYIPDGGHYYQNYTFNNNATCTEDGTETGTCYRYGCNATNTRGKVGSKLGHTPDGLRDCTTPESCSVCGIELQAEAGHSPDGLRDCVTPESCTVCGIELQAEAGHSPDGLRDCVTPESCSVCGIELQAEAGHSPDGLRDCVTPESCTICGIELQAEAGHSPDGLRDCVTPESCSVCGIELQAEAGHSPDGLRDCVTPESCTICGIELQAEAGHSPDGLRDCTTPESCTVCGIELQAEAGHTPDGLRDCVTPESCSVCGIELQAEAGHSPDGLRDCTTPESCTVCGIELQAEAGHTPDGLRDCVTPESCTVCGVELEAALGHTAGAEATCTTDQTCIRCDYVFVEALDHEAGTPATCTTDQTCIRCDHVFETALGHTAGTEATCTTDQTCIRCNHIFVEALGHTWTNATCITPKTCSVCQATEGTALGHNFGDWRETIPVTCAIDGEEEKTCSRCSDSETRAIESFLTKNYRIPFDELVLRAFRSTFTVINNTNENPCFDFVEYEWFRNGVPVGTNQSYYAGREGIQPGTYFVKARFRGSDKWLITDEKVIGADGNPVESRPELILRDGRLYVEANIDESRLAGAELIVFNTAGSVIARIKISERTTKIDPRLASGHVFMLVESNGTNKILRKVTVR